jgi:hypothetical protein
MFVHADEPRHDRAAALAGRPVPSMTRMCVMAVVAAGTLTKGATPDPAQLTSTSRLDAPTIPQR